MENLIIIEGKEKYQYNDIESLIKRFISPRYFELTKEEKEIELEKKAIANTMKEKIQIIRINNKDEYFEQNAFILYDEFSYILSMLKFDKFILLEKVNANIFGKYIDKTKMEDNYIIINKFVDEIMKKYFKNI